MRLRILLLFHLLFIVEVDLRRYNNQNNNNNNSIYELDSRLNNYKPKSNKELLNNDQDLTEEFQRDKKYMPRKKVLNEVDNRDEQEKPIRRTHVSKSTNRSDLSNKSNRIAQTGTTQNYFDEASLCINEYDVKAEQLVKVKELKNGARMIRFVHIEEPSTSHGLDIKDICMLNCCVEENCDLAMLSEQRTNKGYKCYLFACNGSCTYAPHQDYTSMILKKDVPSIDDSPVTNKQSKLNEKSSDASSSTVSTACRSIEFSCRDGTCIPYYDVCNSYDDCPSGIDEAMCSSEFTLHQRTQQENRKKPSTADVDTDTNTDIDENLDEILDDDQLTTTIKSLTKSTSTKSSSSSKSKSKNREGGKQENKNLTSQFFYNIDLDTQERVSRLQKLKEYLEETKGPEAWYHLFQALVQHQNQDHSNSETEQTGSASSNDDDNLHEHLLALEQQWIADRQKSSTTTTIPTTTIVVTSRVKAAASRKPTTTKRMKVINDDDDDDLRRPPAVVDDEISDDEDVDDGDRYYWQPTYDDRRGKQYNNYQQRIKSTTSTRKSRTKSPLINRDTTMTILLRANDIDTENYSHAKSFLRESSVVLLLLLGLILTIILLVLVGFYCRDSWKHGRLLKNRSTDADYLINGLYL